MTKPRRLNIRVTEKMSRQLDRAARLHGVTMTAIIETALARYLEEPGSEPAEALLLRRLDRIDRRQALQDRDTVIILETLQHYILYWLTLTEPVPEGEREGAQALGRRRYDHFAAQVARKVAR
jgi:uncharacterized protein (DUF1778 family)